MPRLHSQQVAHEVVPLAALSVGCSGGTVTGSGDDEEVEVFVCFDEGVDGLHRRGGVDVGVEFADDEEKFSF